MATMKRTATKATTKAPAQHQHILVAAHGNYHMLHCVRKGCKYTERWDGKAYRAYDPAITGRPGSAQWQERIAAQQATAIRPHTLWESEAAQ